MEGKRKKLKGTGIVFIVVLVLILFGLFYLLYARDTMIMYYGIRTWRLLRTVLIVALSAVVLLNVVFQITSYVSWNKRLKEQALNDVLNEESLEAEKRKNAKLSVRGDLDAKTVRELLVEESRGRWSFAYELIYECVEQMEQIDSYQERLKKLLMNNGAEALSNSEEVLDQVEQYLCRNVRNVLNFMEVADDDAADEVRVRLMKCKEENQKLLTQTRDFVYAMADFLNNQSGKADMRMLESYRNTILESIREGEE